MKSENNTELLNLVINDMIKEDITQAQLKSSMKRKGIPEQMYRPYLNILKR